MHEIAHFFKYITSSDQIIHAGGLLVITLIVYAENGLFFAVFLPGDYLLFLSGLFCGTKVLNIPFPILLLFIFTAAVLGSITGYHSGKLFGNSLEQRRDTFFFKKKYIETTKAFYEKYGSKALIISRFLPVVRTFAPILAGVIRMRHSRFLFLNIIGAALWVSIMVGGGYYLGVKFPNTVHYIQYIIIFFLVITSLTVLKGYFSFKKHHPSK